jgi:S1-C subfamily serine protease
MKKIFLIVFCLTSAIAFADITAIVNKVSPSVLIIVSFNSYNEIVSQGTGFAINENEAVTNRHVIEGAKNVIILTSNNKKYTVTHIISPDKNLDLARLYIASKALFPLKIARSDPSLGQSIIVIGNPLGLEQTVSNGIISAIRNDKLFGKVFQLTAPISKGSSGSPVFNMNSEVVGVVTYYISGGQNLNFSLPLTTILKYGQNNKQTFRLWSSQNTKKVSFDKIVKKSKSGICHDVSSRWYKRTKHFVSFNSIEDCLRSGGRLPK